MAVLYRNTPAINEPPHRTTTYKGRARHRALVRTLQVCCHGQQHALALESAILPLRVAFLLLLLQLPTFTIVAIDLLMPVAVGVVRGDREKLKQGMATTSRSRRKQDDEKKSKKKQSPVDDRPMVPVPSEAMLNNLRTAFGLLDRDSDGHVTADELQFMLRNLGIQVSDDLISDLMKDASKTGNGLIDENEFMQWVTKIQAIQGMDVGASGGDSEEEITRDLLAAFKVFDRDDNGYITRDELRSALEMIGEPVTDAQLNQVLALGDIDHDGRIDYEEFVKMLL